MENIALSRIFGMVEALPTDKQEVSGSNTTWVDVSIYCNILRMQKKKTASLMNDRPLYEIWLRGICCAVCLEQ